MEKGYAGEGQPDITIGMCSNILPLCGGGSRNRNPLSAGEYECKEYAEGIKGYPGRGGNLGAI